MGLKMTNFQSKHIALLKNNKKDCANVQRVTLTELQAHRDAFIQNEITITYKGFNKVQMQQQTQVKITEHKECLNTTNNLANTRTALSSGAFTLLLTLDFHFVNSKFWCSLVINVN